MCLTQSSVVQISLCDAGPKSLFRSPKALTSYYYSHYC